MRTCKQCDKELHRTRYKKTYCSDVCKWRFNDLKKDREKHLAPARKRNSNFFSMLIGKEWARSKGQGRRSGGMIKGAMSARVECTFEEWTEITPENLKKHFQGIGSYIPSYIRTGDERIIKKEEITNELGVIF